MHGRTLSTLSVIAVAAATHVGRAAAADPPPVKVIRVPAGGICPRAVVDDGGRLHLVWFRGDPRRGDLFHAASADGGVTFDAPARVNSKPGTVVVIGSVRGPQMAIGRGGRLHVTWTRSGRTGNGSLAMAYARSSEAGRFEPERDLTADHPGLDGGGAVAADAAGHVYLAWHAPDGDTGEAGRRVWLASSSDDGATFAPAVPVSPVGNGCCGCCGLAVAAGPAGRVAVAYRTAAETIHRDMTLLVSTDGGGTFDVSAVDRWRANACVMSTAAVAVADRRTVAVWETRGQVFIVDSARAAGRPVRVAGQGTDCKHPAVAIDGTGRSLVAWTEGTGWDRGGTVAWQLYEADGRPVAGRFGRANALPVWDAPAVVVLPDNSFRILY